MTSASSLPKGLLDESNLPILEVNYPVQATAETLDFLFEAYRRVGRENAQVAYLIDMRSLSLTSTSAPMRRHAAALHARYCNELAKSAVCEARVVSSPMMRGVLVAFDWIKGEGLWPCETFATREEAVAWIGKQLAKGSPGKKTSKG